MNQLMSDEAVYRTAPATLGLLNIVDSQSFYAISKAKIVFCPKVT